MASIEGTPHEDLTLSHVQQAIAQDPEDLEKGHPSLLATIGLDVHPTLPSPKKKIGKIVTEKEESCSRSHRRLFPVDLTNEEVKRQTGFPSVQGLLNFVIVVSNGDMDALMQCDTRHLNWFEEWFFFMEYIWGRIITQYIDAEAIYMVKDSTLQWIFDGRLKGFFRAGNHGHLSVHMLKTKSEGKINGMLIMMGGELFFGK